jgi:hypothetical protein
MGFGALGALLAVSFLLVRRKWWIVPASVAYFILTAMVEWGVALPV